MWMRFYYDWLVGIGGWTILAFLCLLTAIGITLDTENHPRALIWRTAVWLPVLMFIPSLLADLTTQFNPRFDAAIESIGISAAVVGMAMVMIAQTLTLAYIVTGSRAASFQKRHINQKAKRVLSNGVLVNTATQQQYPLLVGTTRIGRAVDNDIVLVHQTVSRNHLQIEAASGQFVLHNLSQSPLRVNGHTLSGAVLLTPDDVIEIGQVRLVFCLAI
jgi:hypothetical protein